MKNWAEPLLSEINNLILLSILSRQRESYVANRINKLIVELPNLNLAVLTGQFHVNGIVAGRIPPRVWGEMRLNQEMRARGKFTFIWGKIKKKNS